MKKLAKRVEIEVLDQRNQRVIVRRRVVPDMGRFFSCSEVDNILETFVEDFEQKNPGHKYRMVEIYKNGCPLFKFVWDAQCDQHGTIQEQMAQVERAEAMAG